MVCDNVDEPFNDLGYQKVKNISRAIRVWQWVPNTPKSEIENYQGKLNQQIQFCIAPDDVQLAYASLGHGPALLKAPNFLNHLDYEWRSPIWGPFLDCLTKNNQLIRFDQRGGGMSEWEVDDISFEAMVSDIGVVADAAKLGKFPLLGISQGCAYSIGYAAQNPERVQALILLGGFARGVLKRGNPDAKDIFQAFQTLVIRGWGSTESMYRNLFTGNFIPESTNKQQNAFDELQRVSLSASNANRVNALVANIDISNLAKTIRVPTLVLHCDGDQVVSSEEGRRTAALIPNARFVSLPGKNHVLVEGTPAFELFFSEVSAFLQEVLI